MTTPPSTSPHAAIPPVRKSVFLRVAPDVAFRRFTAEVGKWWPRRTHSLGGENVVDVVMEGRTGGRFFERQADGSEIQWGWVIAWEPPTRIVLAWHVGQAPSDDQQVEVRFVAHDGGTRVDLEHRGWEKLAEQAREQRDGYDTGWTGVLGFYVQSLN